MTPRATGNFREGSEEVRRERKVGRRTVRTGNIGWVRECGGGSERW